MKNNIIYGLYEPECLGGTLRYIGQSSIGLVRAYQHSNISKLQVKTHKTNWINSLIKQNLMYDVKIIVELPDFVDPQERDRILNEAEIEQIAYFKAQGLNLTNSTDGGEGTRGNVLSDESKQKIAATALKTIEKNGINPSFLKFIQPKEKRIIDGIEHKHCSDCDQFKSLDNFGKDKNQMDGLRSICRKCAGIRNKNRPKNKLTPEELQKSYDDRRVALKNGAKKTSVVLISILDKSIIIEYESIRDAHKVTKLSTTKIYSLINSGKSHNGYTWKNK